MKKSVFLVFCLSVAFFTRASDSVSDALSAAQTDERRGALAAAATAYERIYADTRLPSHQRMAALCGLIRTDVSHFADRCRAGLTASDPVWRGAVAQLIALLPPARLKAVRTNALKDLPVSASLAVQRALVHVKSPAAREWLSDVIAKSSSPEMKREALEGYGRVGSAEDVGFLLTWMQSDDAALAAAARRGLISIPDKKADRALAERLGAFTADAAFLVRLIDVLTVRNPIGIADALVPCLAHADATVRTQTFRALSLQGTGNEMAAVLAAAAKAKDGKERDAARRAVAKISRRAGGVQFKARWIGNCRTEACGVADFNKDGKPDVVAGPYLYLSPDFKPVKIRDVVSDVKEDGKGYAHDFMNLPLDVNGDGLPDVISGDWFSRETWWIENVLPSDAFWKQHLIEKTGNIETGILVDLDGDGKATDFLPDTQLTCLYELKQVKDPGLPFTRDSVSNEKCDMGRGCGDLNGDGRNDILTPSAWYERLVGGGWKKHPLHIGFDDRKLGHASNMIVFDVNKDGRSDILVSSAHKYGIFWWEQKQERGADGELVFVRHVIDDSWTQAHYLGWADLDGDGVPELITGKRFMAHNGNDPDEYGPLGVYYYDFTPGPNPVFKKYVISYDAGVSVGLNVETVDIDGDGDLDLVTTGKYGGPVILENKMK